MEKYIVVVVDRSSGDSVSGTNMIKSNTFEALRQGFEVLIYH